MSLAFYLTGRLWCSVFLAAQSTLALLATEFSSRDDLIGLERSSIWPEIVKAMSSVEQLEYLNYRMVDRYLPLPLP